MSFPNWIADAIEAASTYKSGGEVFPIVPLLDTARLAIELLDRLPVERMVRAATVPVHGDERTDRSVARGVIQNVITAMSGDVSDAVTMTQLYQDACRALDAAGVPYANDDEVPVPLDLPARIRWLALQRPTRLELRRVENERDEARAQVAALEKERARVDDFDQFRGW